jgi:protein phosphatase 1L
MVYDGAVKDQESSAGPAASAALSEASSAAPSEAVVRAIPAKPAHDNRLGVRHPLKYRRFRAGGKMMVEPGGVLSAHAVVEGEEEEEASEVEEDEEDLTSAETDAPSADVEVSSFPAPPVVQVVQEMEVEGSEMELLPEAAVAVGESELEAPVDEEDEVSSPVTAQEERKQEASPAASVEVPKEKDEEKKEKERERQKERERVDEVGYMSGGWKR